MIQAALSGTIVWLLFKFGIKDEDVEVDAFLAFSMIIAPTLLIFLISLGVSFFHLPEASSLPALVLYFAIPFLIFRQGYSVPTAVAAKYSGIVAAIAISIEVLLYVVLQAVSA